MLVLKAVLFGFRKEDEVLGLISFLSWARYISHYLLQLDISYLLMLDQVLYALILGHVTYQNGLERCSISIWVRCNQR